MLSLYLALLPAAMAIWPPVGGPLYANNDQTQCLTAAGQWDGAQVTVQACNGRVDQKWLIGPGSTKVKLGQSNYCLDAGADPANGVAAKVWTCYDGLPAQQWYHTTDDHIALENQGLCLDRQDGGSHVQTWECFGGNTNQNWKVGPVILRDSR